jgi:hypothetical protein
MSMGVQRVFESLTAEFVCSQMIFFAVGFSGGGVGVGRLVVKFRGAGVRALGHDFLLFGLMLAGRQSYRNNFSLPR